MLVGDRFNAVGLAIGKEQETALIDVLREILEEVSNGDNKLLHGDD